MTQLNKRYMAKIEIKVKDYYGNPSYYSVMPQGIFNALESASLNNKEFITVDKAQFDKMIVEHENKMCQWNG